MDAQPSRLAQARSWYLQAVDALPTDSWSKPTMCEGWTAANVVAHVATGDQLFRALIFDATGRDRTGLDLPGDLADRQRRFQALSTWEPAKLKETAQKESEQTVTAIAEAVDAAPQAIVNLAFGPVPMPVVRGMRLNEYIIHGHDLMPAIGQSIASPDWFFDRALGAIAPPAKPARAASPTPMAITTAATIRRVGRMSMPGPARPALTMHCVFGLN